MFKHGLFTLALLMVCWGFTDAQASGPSNSIKALIAEEKTTVEVYFASEHVPAALKPGAKVDLMRVNGKTATPNGKVSYATSTVAPEIEAVAFDVVKEPKTPEQAVKVGLKVTKEQAARIEKIKSQLITQRETNADGSITTVKKPVTFRLELTKQEK